MGSIDVSNKERLTSAVSTAQRELSSTLDELDGAVRQSLDWRAWVAGRPLASAAIAFAIGLRLGRGRWL